MPGSPQEDRRFGELLRTLRQDGGMTQRELANRAGTLHRAADARGTATVVARSHASMPETAGPVRIGVLGPLAVRRGDVPVPVNSAAQRALLARLALAAGTPSPRADRARVEPPGEGRLAELSPRRP